MSFVLDKFKSKQTGAQFINLYYKHVENAKSDTYIRCWHEGTLDPFNSNPSNSNMRHLRS